MGIRERLVEPIAVPEGRLSFNQTSGHLAKREVRPASRSLCETVGREVRDEGRERQVGLA